MTKEIKSWKVHADQESAEMEYRKKCGWRLRNRREILNYNEALSIETGFFETWSMEQDSYFIRLEFEREKNCHYEIKNLEQRIDSLKAPEKPKLINPWTYIVIVPIFLNKKRKNDYYIEYNAFMQNVNELFRQLDQIARNQRFMEDSKEDEIDDEDSATVYHPKAKKNFRLSEEMVESMTRREIMILGITGTMAGMEFRIPPNSTICFGRDKTQCQIIFPAENVNISRLHCELRNYNGVLSLVDRGSSCGTFVEGQILQPEQSYYLHNGEVFSLSSQLESFKVRM